MGTSPIIIRALSWVVIAILAMPPVIAAQESAPPEQSDRFSKEELTQMLAPIALYPDSLIAQILMASTYPLEVVQAERWVRENESLKGTALDDALKAKNWDPSVKSLCHFPDVLVALSDKLDQTRKLGDAFLSQEDDVMAQIQELRRRAEEQGNLKSTEQQKVIVEREIIRIEPANPQVVYVPAYDPFYIYGPWWYPAYPPYYWYYPSGFAVAGGPIYFGAGFFVGLGFSWTWFDWPGSHVYVDYNRTSYFHQHRTRHDAGTTYWRHDPRHRRGVAYRDRGAIERFGRGSPRVSPRSQEFRGYPRGYPERRSRTVAPSRAGEIRQGVGAPGTRPGQERIQRVPRRDTPFSSVGEGSFDHRAGQRGGESRRSGAVRQPSATIPSPGGTQRMPGGSTGSPGGVISPRGGAIREPDGVTGPPPGGAVRQPGGGSGGFGGGMRGSGGGGGTRR